MSYPHPIRYYNLGRVDMWQHVGWVERGTVKPNNILKKHKGW